MILNWIRQYLPVLINLYDLRDTKEELIHKKNSRKILEFFYFILNILLKPYSSPQLSIF